MLWHRVLVIFILSIEIVMADAFDYTEWNNILQQHVSSINNGKETRVNYAAIAADPQPLNNFLTKLSSISQQQFDQWQTNDQLAFLINTYNAWTIELIVKSPSDIKSIKDLGNWFNSPWSREFIPLFGHQRSLDYIEHQLIREPGRFNEPRIHFAVNCASIGCPALSPVAYQGNTIQQQLEQATKIFLSDRSRNRIDGDKLALSSIFKWYREDFERGWQGYTSLEQFLADYSHALILSSHQINQLKSGALAIEYLDYNWRLNGKR